MLGKDALFLIYYASHIFFNQTFFQNREPESAVISYVAARTIVAKFKSALDLTLRANAATRTCAMMRASSSRTTLPSSSLLECLAFICASSGLCSLFFVEHKKCSVHSLFIIFIYFVSNLCRNVLVFF